MFRHGPANTFALSGGVDHETGVGNMTAGAAAIRSQRIRAGSSSIELSNVGPGVVAKPIGKCVLTRNLRIDGVSVAAGHDGMKNVPDAVVICVGSETNI